MSDLKLFRIDGEDAVELPSSGVSLERALQRFVEKNMETLFGVRFLASEYSTGARHRGRIDSLGVDESGAPVILEYKRASESNVINQGLFYLNWLIDHKAEFQLLVQKNLSREQAENLDWSNARLVCVARTFHRYDVEAIELMQRNIDLVRYQYFGDDMFALEIAGSVAQTGPVIPVEADSPAPRNGTATPGRSVSDYLAASPRELQDLFAELHTAAIGLGDDVTRKTLQTYFAYKTIRNFACVEVHPRTGTLLIYLRVDPTTVTLEPGFSRDVTNIGHLGTGNLEVRVTSPAELDKAMPLIRASYEIG